MKLLFSLISFLLVENIQSSEFRLSKDIKDFRNLAELEASVLEEEKAKGKGGKEKKPKKIGIKKAKGKKGKKGQEKKSEETKGEDKKV